MPHAIVVGAGVAELASAIALARSGWSVRVLDRAPELAPLGAALSLWPNALQALALLGLDEAATARGAPIKTMLLADARGRAIIGPRILPAPAVLIARADLQTLLLHALGREHVALGVAVRGVSQNVCGCAVHLADGDALAADLVVDAGGLRSPLGDLAPDFRGYGGVLALSGPMSEEGFGGVAAEYWGWGERFGLFELPGKRRYWFYMRDQAEHVAAPCHAAILARAASFPPAIAATIAATPPERLLPVAIHARAAPRSLGVGRLIRVGDAAHAMEPNLGQGACQALEDAAVLGSLAVGIPPGAILPVFERHRLRRVAYLVRRAAEGRAGAHGALILQATVRTALRLTPRRITESVLRSSQIMPTLA